MSGPVFDLLLQAIPVAFIMFVVLNFGGMTYRSIGDAGRAIGDGAPR